MEEPVASERRRSDGSVRECLFYPVLERNEQQHLELLCSGITRGAGGHRGRPKRWTWAGSSHDPQDGGYTALLECVPSSTDSSPHRSPCRSSSLRCRASITSDKAPDNERNSISAHTPARRFESPTASPQRSATPRRVRCAKSRCQSPSAVFPSSPVRQRLDEEEINKHFNERTTKMEQLDKKIHKSLSRDVAQCTDASPGTGGKAVAGTTDAEEASKLLAERRRQARMQKELEEREQEERRMREEEEKIQREHEALQLEEERQRAELERRECRWKELQVQLEKEREEVLLRAQQEAERQHQEREQLKLQEEQERLQRKKRIEEIMKRTRKNETEMKKDEIWAKPLSALPLKQSISSPLLEMTVVGQGDTETCGEDEAADDVQAMDVSPVSKEELIPQPQPEPQPKLHRNMRELSGHTSNPTHTTHTRLGDYNRNLICNTDPQLLHNRASHKVHI